VLRAPFNTVATPLGVRLVGEGLLEATIYPGTRLAHVAPQAYEACIGFSLEPSSFAKLLLNKDADMVPPRAVSTPCLGNTYLRIEAVIARRLRSGDRWVLTLEPLFAYTAGTPPSPYTRALGCMVELLVAYTRVAYWSRQKPRGCREAQKWYTRLLQAADCISHGAPHDEEL